MYGVRNKRSGLSVLAMNDRPIRFPDRTKAEEYVRVVFVGRTGDFEVVVT